MIPILYYGNETSFTSNGIGRLTEIVSCKVTEERNGVYEVEFEYPSSGKYYNTLVNMVNAYAVGVRSAQGIIACIHDDRHDIQPFDIYSFSAPIDGVATFYAHHISYRLNGMIIKPVDAGSPADMMDYLQRYQVGADSFTFWTDKVASGNLKTNVFKQIRGLLGGEEGSILDVYGKGEYQFDKFAVKLYVNRGIDTGVTIRYGKNMVDVTRESDNSDKYNAVAPYWIGQDTDENTGESTDAVVLLPGNGYIKGTNAIGSPNIVSMDFSGDFDEKPSVNQLQARALQFLDDNTPWVPTDNITVNFVQLWQTTEYENVAALQRVSLCDTVSVYYPEIGIIASNQKIIKVVYDVLLERYEEMEIGEPGTSLSDSITQALREQYEQELEAAKKDALTYSVLQAAIQHATELLTGGLGGYVIFNTNANGEPQEILIMDHPDINTAVNVIRMNKNGIGFSTTGYNGPFTTAWTIDGAFNAAFITAGTISANLIKGGTLKLGGLGNGNGILKVYDADNRETFALDINGFIQNGYKHKYSDNVISVVPGDPDSPYYYETPENNYYTPARFPNLIWYRNRIVQNSGGIYFKVVQTNNTSGPITPTEIAIAKMRATYSGLILTTESQKTTIIGGNAYGATIRLGETLATMPSSEKTTLRHVDVYSDSLNLVYGTPLRFYNSTRLAELYPQGAGLRIDLRPADQTRFQTNVIDYQFGADGTFLCDNLQVNYSKSRAVETKDYSKRLLYCYEMPSPMFGDIGEGVIDEEGEAYIFIDSIFEQTICTETAYQVFLQKYGEGDCWVSKRTKSYFVVKGTPGLKFAWEMKAKQIGTDQQRLERSSAFDSELDREETDYGVLAEEYISELMEGRIGI